MTPTTNVDLGDLDVRSRIWVPPRLAALVRTNLVHQRLLLSLLQLWHRFNHPLLMQCLISQCLMLLLQAHLFVSSYLARCRRCCELHTNYSWRCYIGVLLILCLNNEYFLSVVPSSASLASSLSLPVHTRFYGSWSRHVRGLLTVESIVTFHNVNKIMFVWLKMIFRFLRLLWRLAISITLLLLMMKKKRIWRRNHKLVWRTWPMTPKLSVVCGNFFKELRSQPKVWSAVDCYCGKMFTHIRKLYSIAYWVRVVNMLWLYM